MYESRIAAGHLTVAARTGAAPALDVLAMRNLSGHGFLRAAWYAEGAPDALRTLVAEREDGTFTVSDLAERAGKSADDVEEALHAGVGYAWLGGDRRFCAVDGRAVRRHANV